MINALIKTIEKIKDAKCTVLAMDIIEKTQYYNKDIVKIIHNKNGEVLYTSRSPVPYCKKFNKKIKAKRVGGLFAFRWNFLKKFYNTKESFLEKIESCDSNRICDNGGGQYIAHYKYKPYFSVDSPGDLKIVNKYMKKDKIYKKYKYLSISE
jgi:3-deoxy-manno-octulosonate cytidylyltransferase (CMP-KDO synthetase)